jgi:hypothetical protein
MWLDYSSAAFPAFVLVLWPQWGLQHPLSVCPKVTVLLFPL